MLPKNLHFILICRLPVFREPIEIASLNVDISNLARAYNISLWMSIDNRCRIIEQNLLHINDKLAALAFIKFTNILITQGIIFSITIARAILWIGTIHISTPIHIHKVYG